MPLISHEFRNPDLLTQALTHRSYGRPDNERFEFLGDAVLQLLTSEILFERFPKAAEGELTRRRAGLVREKTLAAIARSLNLGDHLRLGPGELKSGGFRRDSILADACEALIGAVFLDGGMAAARQAFVPLLDSQLAVSDEAGKDPKTGLQELLQGNGLPPPRYELIEARGDDHCKLFTARCLVETFGLATEGVGSSRRLAETEAARSCLELALARLAKPKNL